MTINARNLLKGAQNVHERILIIAVVVNLLVLGQPNIRSVIEESGRILIRASRTTNFWLEEVIVISRRLATDRKGSAGDNQHSDNL